MASRLELYWARKKIIFSFISIPYFLFSFSVLVFSFSFSFSFSFVFMIIPHEHCYAIDVSPRAYVHCALRPPPHTSDLPRPTLHRPRHRSGPSLLRHALFYDRYPLVLARYPPHRILASTHLPKGSALSSLLRIWPFFLPLLELVFFVVFHISPVVCTSFTAFTFFTIFCFLSLFYFSISL